jgi:hypothetical protein
MHQARFALLAAAGLSLALSACSKQQTAATGDANGAAPAAADATDHKDPVASAMAAAPESVARNAAVIASNPDGTMRRLREGTNGFTCMPDNPATPGPDPMCLDANALRWVEAMLARRPPPADAVGMAYMLAGGTDASNTDPYATQPTEGNNWIETGPHLMIFGSKEMLTGHPANPKPDTSAPYVMWANTPYAHLMVPVAKS